MLTRSFFRRTATAIAVVVMSSTLLAGPWVDVALAQAKEMPGKGAGGGMPVAVTGNAVEAASSVYENVITQLTRTGVVALFNAAQTFFGQIAYDAANFIASGGKGQAAVFYKKGFGEYMAGVASDAMGDFVGSLSDGQFFRTVGFNLCQPTNPLTTLRLQVGIGTPIPPTQAFQRPRPKCDFQKVQANWNSWATTMSNVDVLQTIGQSFSMNSNDLGVSVSIMGQSVYREMNSVNGASADRNEGDGFQAIRDQISGRVRTPASVVEETTAEQVVRKPGTQLDTALENIMSNAFEQGPIQLALYTSSMFLNTLSSKLLKRIFEKGLGAFDFSDLEAQRAVTGVGADSIVTQGATDARQANIDLKSVNLQGSANYELLTELISCPSTNRGTWNCTMDQALANALQQNDEQGAATVRSAIANNQLHGDWKLIPEKQTRENQDPMCYTYGYCAGNLQKLRLARILSVGFEFAANTDENVARCGTSAGCVTLKEVVDHFLDCNAEGKRDASHPWCHLIDPQWVITRIPQQCVLNGYGENLMSDALSQRRQECQDIQTCLKRNDKGECIGGYGYCLSERTAYRFGADECKDRYASCRSYTSRSGEQVSLLRNTLDYGVCNADNVGCQWYATIQNPTSTMTMEWKPDAPATSRQYMNAKMEGCSASGDGCTKLYRASFGTASLNLILNPSFEQHTTDTVPMLREWIGADGGIQFLSPQENSAPLAAEGYGLFSGTQEAVQTVALAPARMYTLSYYARAIGGSASSNATHVTLQQMTATGASVALSNEYQSGCRVGTSNILDASMVGSALTSNWQRVFCTFQSTVNTRKATITVFTSGAYIDAVQLEESEAPSVFVDGVNTQLPAVHLKLPPDELGCVGASNDVPLCSKFAKACTQLDAGCDGYRDTSIGGSEVPAVLNQGDLCPSSCVGYAEYRKQRSAFDLVKDVDSQLNDESDSAPAYFIPSTAGACTQAVVGCEEFTNVDALASGGEQKAYFTYTRSCEKPNADSTTYFTWEGSDTAGFQLRTWSLIKETDLSPKLVVKMAPGSSIYKQPNTCNETTWRSGSDADCRQFYDKDGTVFYAYMSQTVLSTNDCTTYRLNRSNLADCQHTGGDFNATTGECRYKVYAPESRTCSATAVGCRAYAGSTSANVQTIYSNDFKAGLNGFMDRNNGTSEISTSNESLLVGDLSMKVARSGSLFDTRLRVATKPTDLLRVTFWAKMPGTSASNASLNLNAGDADLGGSRTVGTVTIGSDWQKYSIGLFSGQADSSTTTLHFVVTGPSVPALYIDEVQVQTQNDLVYVKRDSWTTPVECNTTLAGIPQPQAMLGCRAYTNRRGDAVNVRQFQRLCKQEAIGCSAFVDTRNSGSVGAQSTTLTYNTVTRASGSSASTVTPGSITVTRGADRMVYFIDDLAKRCQPEEASCRAFGLPVMTPDRTRVDRYVTVYGKDDITKYDVGLCRPSELYCDAFNYGAATEYFKDPKNHACEYKEQVAVTGTRFTIPDTIPPQYVTVATGTYAGWFIKGSTTPCYPDALAGGKEFGIFRVDDSGYRQYGGLCAPQNGECTEFRDPNDLTDPLHPSGKPYYFIKNDRLDTSTCGGNVDTDKGCVLMRDLTDSSLQFSTRASYTAYQESGYAPMSPVNCDDGLSNPTCAKLGITTNDANLIVKVKKDRDCLQWLGCKSAETVFDPAQRRYIQVCTDVAMCDRASGKAGDNFCAGYVNRSTEAMLPQGGYFDVAKYANRSVRMGDRDYSGYALPNAFQVPDLVSMTVAKDGLSGESARNLNGLALDYRLAGVAYIPHNGNTFATPEKNQARILCPKIGSRPGCVTGVVSQIAQRFPELFLCQHAGSGRIGFYDGNNVKTGGSAPIPCYFSVHGDSDVFDFQNIQEKFLSSNTSQDPQLSTAFPEPECRANPEADAPFGADIVTRWDLTTNPPKALEKLPGFGSANTCEFGEDCVCGYKRADYSRSAVTKFYGINSPNVPPGICQGGPRDGQSCIPDTVMKAPNIQSTRTSQGSDLVRAIEGSNASQSCGSPDQGGTCVPFSKVQIVRGVFGQCLERDSSRTVGGDQNRKPCLTWNPNPVLFGDKDPYHYNPQAGYNPPQNSGQYYCLSEAHPPKTIRLDWSTWQPAGGESHISYDDEFVSDGSGILTGGNRVGGAIDGSEPRGSQTANQCEYADDDQDDGDQIPLVQSTPTTTRSGQSMSWLSRPENAGRWVNQMDDQAVRLIGTGKDREHSRAEAFFPVQGDQIAGKMFESDVSSALAGQSLEKVSASLRDTSIGYFSIRPFENPNGNGRIACGYQAEWVDGMSSVDYDNLDETKRADSEWRQKFFENYNPVITRGSEKLLTRTNNNAQIPAVADCVNLGELDPIKSANPDSKCYFKYWENGYRAPETASGADAPFARGIFSDDKTTITRSFNDLQRAPKFGSCTADKPYFVIRPVFEARVENPSSPAQTMSAISGPWYFVGFWVETCSGQASDYRYIYTYVDLVSADVCTQLAEVKSKTTSQDAAFTDRVWRESGYTVPGVGTQYNARFSPFSSALNTGPAGKDPLFQVGTKASGYSPLHPPTFLSSGADTYFRYDQPDPKDKWGYLTNLFARVYRVYRFESLPVTKTDKACVSGPFKGRNCNASNNACAFNGVCKTDSLSAQAMQSISLCNSMSGMNSGLSCIATPDMCHTAPVDPRGVARGQAKLMQLPCELQSGWTQDGNGWKNGDTTYDADSASRHGAFACPNAWYSVRAGQYCSKPSAVSAECPMAIRGVCVENGNSAQPKGQLAIGGSTPGKCKFYLPREKADGTYELPGTRNVNGFTNTSRASAMFGANGSPDDAQFDWVDASSQYPSCYADYDCSFTWKNFYLEGKYPYSPLHPFNANALSSADPNFARDTGGGPIWSMRSTAYLRSSNSGDQRTYARETLHCNDAVNVDKCLMTTTLQYNLSSGGVAAGEIQPNKSKVVAVSLDPNWKLLQPVLGTSDSYGNYTSTDYALNLSENQSGGYSPSNGDYYVSEFQRWPGVGRAENLPRTAFGKTSDATTNAFADGFEAWVNWDQVAGAFLRWIGLGASAKYTMYNLAACEQLSSFASGPKTGRCEGGLKEGSLCRLELNGTWNTYVDLSSGGSNQGGYGCQAVTDPENTTAKQACQSVNNNSSCVGSGGDPNSTDPDRDRNSCTHGTGYIPQANLCPDPSDEFCGLVSYRINNQPASNDSLNSIKPTIPLPTDVTMGHYTPSYLGYRASPLPTEFYTNYYKPVPPRISAPDTRYCANGGTGSCKIQRMDAFSIDGISEGQINVPGGQYKSTIRFYGWAAHNQMPIRKLVIDWGDGTEQALNDAKIKNHKPFCGVQKECSDPVKGLGLTCQTDSDCPAGTGLCKDLGLCQNNPSTYCRQDSDCGVGGSCKVRTFFGNSPDACEANYFEFTHVYACNGNMGLSQPCPTTEYRCSGDPDRTCTPGSTGACAAGDTCIAGLATIKGCFETNEKLTCRFTPRVYVQDNWGWCSGECRSVQVTAGVLDDQSSDPVKHPYGGCWSGGTLGGGIVRKNTEGGRGIQSNSGSATDPATLGTDTAKSGGECSIEFPSDSGDSRDSRNFRPWIVFPGSINLRATQ